MTYIKTVRCGQFEMRMPSNRWQWTRYLLATVAAKRAEGNRVWVGSAS